MATSALSLGPTAASFGTSTPTSHRRCDHRSSARGMVCQWTGGTQRWPRARPISASGSWSTIWKASKRKSIIRFTGVPGHFSRDFSRTAAPHRQPTCWRPSSAHQMMPQRGHTPPDRQLSERVAERSDSFFVLGIWDMGYGGRHSLFCFFAERHFRWLILWRGPTTWLGRAVCVRLIHMHERMHAVETHVICRLVEPRARLCLTRSCTITQSVTAPSLTSTHRY
mmetsp:Transcript_39381/g.112344  ORF Transcript_39381/g.112344 Transcript_39381/m.112344 type:complete len:224 (+) Transcript_39381:1146-1817(+)